MGRLCGISKDIFPHVSVSGLNVLTYCMVPVGMFITIGQAQTLLSEHTLPQKFADFVHERADAEYEAFAEHLPGSSKDQNVGKGQHQRGFGYAMKSDKDEKKAMKLNDNAGPLQSLQTLCRDEKEAEDVEPSPDQKMLDIAIKLDDNARNDANTLQFLHRHGKDGEDVQPSPDQKMFDIAIKLDDNARNDANTLQFLHRHGKDGEDVQPSPHRQVLDFAMKIDDNNRDDAESLQSLQSVETKEKLAPSPCTQFLNFAMSLDHGAVQEPQHYAKLLLPQKCSVPYYHFDPNKNCVYVALTPPSRLYNIFDQMRRSECAACDAADAMFKLDLFLSLLNRALIATVHGKNYRNDIGEDMGPALSMAAYSDGFKSNMQSFLAIGDCEDWMAKFTQLCNTMRDDIVTRLSDMDAQITCEIKGIRIEFITSSGDSLCHTATGVLYCNKSTKSCQLHVVENTDAIAIANNLCPDIAKLFSRVLSHDEAHRRYYPCSISAYVLYFLALLQNLTHPNLHRCRKSNTYKLLTLISNASYLNLYN